MLFLPSPSSTTRTHAHLPNHLPTPTHTTAIMNQTHTSLDLYTPLIAYRTVKPTQAFNSV